MNRLPWRLGVAVSGAVLATSTAFVTAAQASPAGATAFVTSFTLGTTTVIDTATATTTTPIPTGGLLSGAQRIGITRDGKTAYVLNTNVSTVVPFTVATHQVGAAIPVANPNSIAFSPDGRTAYVTDNVAGSTITPIDLATNTAGPPFSSGGLMPTDVAISRDGKTLYVVNMGSNNVVPINLATRTAEAPIITGIGLAGLTLPVPAGNPTALVISPDGRTLYETNFGDGRLVRIDTATRTILPPVLLAPGLANLDISPDGKSIFVANFLLNQVVRVDARTGQVGATTSVVNPFGVTVSPDSKSVYVPGFTTSTVTIIDAATGVVRAGVPVGLQPVTVTFTK